MQQHLGQQERIVQVALAQEVGGCGDGGAASPGVRRRGELAEDVTGFVCQVAADDIRRRQVDQVPVVDAIETANVEVEQVFAPRVWYAFGPRLLVHDAHRADTRVVEGAIKQLLNLIEGHL